MSVSTLSVRNAKLVLMEERLAALEARIRELETAARRPMRESLRCPMCGGRSIYGSTAKPGDWVLMFLGHKGSGLRKRAAVPCTADACATCGFVELHALNVAEETDMELLVTDDPVINSPYR